MVAYDWTVEGDWTTLRGLDPDGHHLTQEAPPVLIGMGEALTLRVESEATPTEMQFYHLDQMDADRRRTMSGGRPYYDWRNYHLYTHAGEHHYEHRPAAVEGGWEMTMPLPYYFKQGTSFILVTANWINLNSISDRHFANWHFAVKHEDGGDGTS